MKLNLEVENFIKKRNMEYLVEWLTDCIINYDFKNCCNLKIELLRESDSEDSDILLFKIYNDFEPNYFKLNLFIINLLINEYFKEFKNSISITQAPTKEFFMDEEMDY